LAGSHACSYLSGVQTGEASVTGEYVVHGAKGTGSVTVEATLTLLGLPYRVVEATLFDEGAAESAELRRVNPMTQVPALILPGGEMMTESAAILIWLADGHPEARLSPGLTANTRPAFLRWMAFVASAIYALYWIRDDTRRIIDDPDVGKEARRRIAARLLNCWRAMDAQVEPGRYILGHDLTVLDLYVTVVSRWPPGRGRFADAAPKLAQVAQRVDADPRLETFWAQRFPFE
jgi:GST-like protein